MKLGRRVKLGLVKLGALQDPSSTFGRPKPGFYSHPTSAFLYSQNLRTTTARWRRRREANNLGQRKRRRCCCCHHGLIVALSGEGDDGVYYIFLTSHFSLLSLSSEPQSQVQHSNVGLILTYTKIMVRNKNNCGWLIMGPHFCT